LFSRKTKFDKASSFFEITKANSFLEEIELCVKQINYIIKTTDTKFSDIAICADSSYFKILKSERHRFNFIV
jgi:hypothetical protein